MNSKNMIKIDLSKTDTYRKFDLEPDERQLIEDILHQSPIARTINSQLSNNTRLKDLLLKDIKYLQYLIQQLCIAGFLLPFDDSSKIVNVTTGTTYLRIGAGYSIIFMPNELPQDHTPTLTSMSFDDFSTALYNSLKVGEEIKFVNFTEESM